MDIPEICKLKSNDGVVIEISKKSALKSGLLTGIMNDYSGDAEIPLNKVNSQILLKVVDYLKQYENSEAPKIQKPLKSKNFSECVSQWENDFLGDDNETLLSLEVAAIYMEIEPLIELVSAKLSSKLKALDEAKTEKIRQKFNIGALNEEEQKQLEEDKKIILNLYSK